MNVEFYMSADGDWINIFVDSVCVFAGHNISAFTFAEILATLNSGISSVCFKEWVYDDDETANPVVHGITLGEQLS